MSAVVDPVWGSLGAGMFEPCALARLAEMMRDGKWLDARTEDGLLQRVRIMEMRLYVRSEDIVFRQDWLDVDDRVRHREIIVDSDAVWKVWPTKTPIESVATPAEEPLFAPTGDAELDLLLQATVAIVSQEAGVAPDALAGRRGVMGRWGVDVLEGATFSETDARYAAMLVVMANAKDLRPETLTSLFGYRSVMPWQSAREKVQRDSEPRDTRFRDLVKSCELKVMAVLRA